MSEITVIYAVWAYLGCRVAVYPLPYIGGHPLFLGQNVFAVLYLVLCSDYSNVVHLGYQIGVILL